MSLLNLSSPGGGIGALAALTALSLLGPGCTRLTEVDEGPAASLADQGDDASGLESDGGAGADVAPAPRTTVDSNQPSSGARVTLDHEVVDKQVVVKVTLHSFTDLVGLAGHLRYDPKGLHLAKVAGHPVLKSTGFDSRTVVRESPAGRILLGGARFRINTTPWAAPEGAWVGHQLWATLTFDVLAAGSHRIHFDPLHALAKDSDYDDIGPAWGELTVSHQEVKP